MTLHRLGGRWWATPPSSASCVVGNTAPRNGTTSPPRSSSGSSERVSGKHLHGLFHRWLYTAGRPELKTPQGSRTQDGQSSGDGGGEDTHGLDAPRREASGACPAKRAAVPLLSPSNPWAEAASRDLPFHG